MRLARAERLQSRQIMADMEQNQASSFAEGKYERTFKEKSIKGIPNDIFHMVRL